MIAISSSQFSAGVSFLRIPAVFAVLNIILFGAFLFSSQLYFSSENSASFWTYYTCHFTHWDFSHYIANIICFSVLGMLLYSIKPPAFFILLFLSPFFISLSFHVLEPDLHFYCGLSGVVSSLFASLTILYLFDNDYRLRGIILMTLLLLKLTLENTISVTPFMPVNRFEAFPLAHSAGAFAGIFLTLILIRSK